MDMAEIIDKNVDRFVQAINDLGPDAQYLFKTLVGRTVLIASGELFVGVILFLISWFACKYFIKVIKKYGEEPQSVLSVLAIAVLILINAVNLGFLPVILSNIIYPEAATIQYLLK